MFIHQILVCLNDYVDWPFIPSHDYCGYEKSSHIERFLFLLPFFNATWVNGQTLDDYSGT